MCKSSRWRRYFTWTIFVSGMIQSLYNWATRDGSILSLEPFESTSCPYVLAFSSTRFWTFPSTCSKVIICIRASSSYKQVTNWWVLLLECHIAKLVAKTSFNEEKKRLSIDVCTWYRIASSNISGDSLNLASATNLP